MNVVYGNVLMENARQMNIVHGDGLLECGDAFQTSQLDRTRLVVGEVL